MFGCSVSIESVVAATSRSVGACGCCVYRSLWLLGLVVCVSQLLVVASLVVAVLLMLQFDVVGGLLLLIAWACWQAC